MSVTLGILKDSQSNERRVSIVPDTLPKLMDLGLEVIVESGAGQSSYFPDRMYVEQGAAIIGKREELLEKSDLITSVHSPSVQDLSMMRQGSVVVGMLQPEKNAKLIEAARNARINMFALERIPRITRAQSMDVLSSQASVAGYRAVILGAAISPMLMPMLTTAAGTVQPARVLVIGAGVAGLMAIATARRLGATVTAYDVRRAAGEDVRSLGARFLEPDIDASSHGGYARELTPEEEKMQKQLLEDAIVDSDVIVTTASVPGRTAPRIISRETVERMAPGTSIIDLAADSGGNCELTKPGNVEEYNGVKISGPLNLASEVPINASRMYSRNIASFIGLVVSERKIVKSFDDEILAACLVSEGTVAD